MNKSTSPWLPREDRKRSKDLKQEAVLLAAARAFGQRGYKATRIDDIADDLNVTKPTIYYYYRSKEALLRACIDRAISEVEETIGQLPADTSPEEEVSAFLSEYLSLMANDIGRCLANTSEYDVRPQARSHLKAAKRNVDQMLHAMIEKGIKQGVFEARDPTITTSVLFGAMNAVATWPRSGRKMATANLKETISSMLIKGILKRDE